VNGATCTGPLVGGDAYCVSYEGVTCENILESVYAGTIETFVCGGSVVFSTDTTTSCCVDPLTSLQRKAVCVNSAGLSVLSPLLLMLTALMLWW
jgi:hypothetical protein